MSFTTKSFKKFILTEAISNTNSERAGILIQKYLSRKLNTPFHRLAGIEEYSNAKELKGYGLRFFYGNGKSVRFNWDSVSVDSAALSSIDVWVGKDSAPDFHVTFDVQMSLVKTLPIIVEILKKPKIGSFDFSTDNLNEEVDIESLLCEEILEEGSGDVLYDEAVAHLKRGEQMLSSNMGASHFNIIKKIKEQYESSFETKGKKGIVFVGDPEFFKQRADEVRAKIGRVKVRVSSGPAKETYKPSKQVVELEQNQERIAYDIQVQDLYELTQVVAAGGSNAMFVGGRGGCLAPETKIEVILNTV